MGRAGHREIPPIVSRQSRKASSTGLRFGIALAWLFNGRLQSRCYNRRTAVQFRPALSKPYGRAMKALLASARFVGISLLCKNADAQIPKPDFNLRMIGHEQDFPAQR
jgi:hypothetical protein